MNNTRHNTGLLNIEFATNHSDEQRRRRNKRNNKTKQETDIMLISRLAPFPIRRQRLHPPLQGMLDTMAKGAFIFMPISIPVCLGVNHHNLERPMNLML